MRPRRKAALQWPMPNEKGIPMANTPTFLSVSFIRNLSLDPAQHPHGQAHLSAASGLVRVRQRLYVVADDELHLGVFEEHAAPGEAGTDPAPGTLVRLLDGDLPRDKGKRKKAKPDLETLAQLPPLPGCPAGALLALGSGSKPQRETGVLIGLDVHGVPNGRMASVNLEPLYAPLRKRFDDLNIEGAFMLSGDLLLLHRGNKGDARSACIRYDWNLIAPWMAGLQPKPPNAKSVQLMQLGDVCGVPLSLTDGTALQGGAWAFSAVAECTENSYQDGACVGSAIGIVAPDGQLRHLHPLAGAPKIEGLVAQGLGSEWVFTLVTDPDDPKTPSQMLQARMPLNLG